ncbi:putative Mg2+ transporter-C (MgtC) family protein [Filimonas lacunae]|uniref:Putative Mg2+ transporter-C (MgtC) family protein n=1 Tax=Filimonas lacunae TaxID=477680 RepID=A0A173MBM6_9BACT|nr:MgtC/SapB family protein [Filimonas lacunae]BAV04964.1 Mg(2+) transport ATPase protein C [Filimonas lacunae]SIT33720.1 putative Mg2+ transporter-C (MgtC) family protein [Filimonas lacunae]
MDIEIVFRFLLAALWGGLVGAEREYRSKSAGFRTMIMISMGSCFFTIMSMGIGGVSNPDRIAANIVTGIGFLGAGVIFKESNNRVQGITTAATIWSVAAVGMGIGGGYYLAAGAASLLILAVLAVLHSWETLIDKLNQAKTYSLKCSYSPEALDYFERIIHAGQVRFKLIKQTKEGDCLWLVWHVEGHERRHRQLAVQLMKDARVLRFEQ